MIYLYCFIIGGLICAIAQYLMDKFKLMPIYITCLFVLIGSLLTVGDLYKKLIDCSGFGASLPISSFGYSLTSAAIEKAEEVGYLGILTGMFDKTASGIIFVIVISFILSLFVKPKG